MLLIFACCLAGCGRASSPAGGAPSVDPPSADGGADTSPGFDVERYRCSGSVEIDTGPGSAVEQRIRTELDIATLPRIEEWDSNADGVPDHRWRLEYEDSGADRSVEESWDRGADGIVDARSLNRVSCRDGVFGTGADCRTTAAELDRDGDGSVDERWTAVPGAGGNDEEHWDRDGDGVTDQSFFLTSPVPGQPERVDWDQDRDGTTDRWVTLQHDASFFTNRAELRAGPDGTLLATLIWSSGAEGRRVDLDTDADGQADATWTVTTTGDGVSRSLLDTNVDGVPEQIWSTTAHGIGRDRDGDGNAEIGSERLDPDSGRLVPTMGWWEDRDDDGAVDYRCVSTWEGKMGSAANLIATERSSTECSKTPGGVDFRFRHAFSDACLTLPSDRFARPTGAYFAPNLAARVYAEGAEVILGLARERAFTPQLRTYFSMFTRETFERVPLLATGYSDPAQLVRTFE